MIVCKQLVCRQHRLRAAPERLAATSRVIVSSTFSTTTAPPLHSILDCQSQPLNASEIVYLVAFLSPRVHAVIENLLDYCSRLSNRSASESRQGG